MNFSWQSFKRIIKLNRISIFVDNLACKIFYLRLWIKKSLIKIKKIAFKKKDDF